MAKPGVLLIVGSGHSGSTVIDMSLGRRVGMISLGEYDRIGDYLKKDPTCVCRQRFSTCTFWQALLAKAPVAATQDGDPLALASAVAEVMPEISWMVDGSKKVDRARRLCDSAPDRTKVLHLTRDGRGVMGSHAKQGFRNLEDFTKDWFRLNRAAECLVADLGPGRARHLTYEAFCKDPHVVIRGVLEWLDEGFGASPERTNRTTHNLAGNRKRYTFHKRVAEDLSWKDRLTPDDLDCFERHAGDLNRFYLTSPQVWENPTYAN